MLHWPSLTRLAGYNCGRMANLVSLSLRPTERHVRGLMQVKLAIFVQNLRMHDAELLLHSDLRIFEISALLGYRHPEHLCRAFTKHFGYSPTLMRRISADHSLEAAVFLKEYCELLEEKAAETTDCNESQRLRDRIPHC